VSTRPFTPGREPVEDLDRRTVGRDRLLGVLVERLRLAATTQTRQHTLLVGPRGSGKTHLLRVALHRALADEQVAGGLAVATVAEDAVGLTSYVDLLRELAKGLQVDVGLSRDPSFLERALLDEAGERTLVVIIENLDRVFRAIKLAGQGDLRSWVETSRQVLIFAGTPALFPAIHDRSKPWFGSLIQTPLEGLSADEGRELLIRLADDKGDRPLVDALCSEQGRARINAVSQLTAGSPRLWMVFSDCLNVDSLDELIPAVEGLVEGLVPYYQGLLWDLPDNHQAIISRLAAVPAQASWTASQIAADTGLSEQTVSKALGLLEKSRWVSAQKAPTGDRRKTWYSVREPMLRHHLQWRATEGEPLRLVVDMLREWYDPPRLRQYLSFAAPESPSERYLAESLRATPTAYDFAATIGTPEALQTEARTWLLGGNPVFPAQCGLYVYLCVTAQQKPEADLHALARQRCNAHPILRLPPSGFNEALVAAASADTEIPDMLLVAAQWSDGDVAASLTLLAATLLGPTSPRRACELLEQAKTDPKSPLGFAAALEHAFWTCEAGDPPHASLDAVRGLLPAIEKKLGTDDVMTLRARANLAGYVGETGDATQALHLYQELQADCERTLGPNDRDTLTTRNQVAYYTGKVGDTTQALHLYQELLVDVQRLRPDDDTFLDRVRRAVASWQRRAEDRTGTTELLARALSGDEEARMMLPAELHPLVDGTPPTS